MITDLKPYPSYKDPGAPWMRAIPAHWEVLRNGRLFAQRVETGYPDLPVLEVSLRTGVRVRTFGDVQRKQVMSDRDKYKRAVKRDIAYNMMRLWQGAVGVAPMDGLVSPAYVVARPYAQTDSRYYAYLFRTPAYMNEVNKYSRGIVKDRNRLYWDEFKQMPSPFPPIDEQKSIADFLDAHDRHVARYIHTKQRLIALLNEQKQAIIDRAVTRGADACARLRPSGIDWLGDVPAHWSVRYLKQVAEVQLSGVDKNSVDGELAVRLCNYTDVYKHDDITRDIEFMPATATEAEIASLTLRAGDILITKDSEMWDDIAIPALVAEDLGDVLCGYHLALVRPEPANVGSEFLFRAFTAPTLARQFHLAATGVTRYGLSKHAIKNAVFPVPGLEEQIGICRWIADKLAPLAAAVQRARSEIALIREYRTRLIADVVTGKLDVRHVAPEPPASVDGQAWLEDIEAALADKGEDAEDPDVSEDVDDGEA
jgi:type I restriction enzyme, S subunit